MSIRSLRKSSRSSALLMAGSAVPSSRTPYLSSTPASARVDGQVEPRLTTQCRQDAVGTLGVDDALQDGDRERLDVDDVGDALVGHDGGWVGVDQHRGDALFAEGLAGLGAGVVELRRLPDDDGPGADYENLRRFRSLAHDLSMGD